MKQVILKILLKVFDCGGKLLVFIGLPAVFLVAFFVDGAALSGVFYDFLKDDVGADVFGRLHGVVDVFLEVLKAVDALFQLFFVELFAGENLKQLEVFACHHYGRR